MDVADRVRRHQRLCGVAVDRMLYRRDMDVHRDDAMSDAMLGLWRAAATYDASRGIPFLAYARAVIRRALADGVRERIGRTGQKRAVAQPGTLETLSDMPAPESSDEIIERVDLRRALAALPERHRHAVLIVFWHNQPLRVLAQRYGVSESRACQIVGEAKAALRVALTDAPHAETHEEGVR